MSWAYRAHVNKAKTSALCIQENPKVGHSLILGPGAKAGRPEVSLGKKRKWFTIPGLQYILTVRQKDVFGYHNIWCSE
jgi:hypothetical protein